jgi:DNA invertase Pin-like site-specific DNA recombinase
MTLVREAEDGSVFRIQPARKLTPAQEQEIARLFGQHVSAHVIANRYGISLRQVYRVKDRADLPRVEATVGEYRAWFEMSEEGPVQITGWVAA